MCTSSDRVTDRKTGYIVDTSNVVPDPIYGKKGGEEGDKQDKAMDGGADGEVTP